MKNPPLATHRISLTIAAVIFLGISLRVGCDQLSTVFVLETDSAGIDSPENSSSKSSSFNSSSSQSVNEHAKIITDDTPRLYGANAKQVAHQTASAEHRSLDSSESEDVISGNKDEKHHNHNTSPTQQSNHQSQSYHSTSSSSQNHQSVSKPANQLTASPSNHQKPDPNSGYKNVSSSPRRLEESTPSEPHSHHKVASTHNHKSNTNHHAHSVHNQPLNHNQHGHSQSTHERHKPATISSPQVDERLLISISSVDDGEDSMKPITSVVSTPTNGGKIISVLSPSPSDSQVIPATNQGQAVPLESNTGAPSSSPSVLSPPSSPSSPQHGAPKRKPSITISIQEPKQGPSLILRPSENGQSIVISTVDTSGGSYSSGSSENVLDPFSSDSRPPEPIVTNSAGSSKPYRQPVNSPLNINNQQPIQQNQKPPKSHNTPTVHHHHSSQSSTTRAPVINIESDTPIISTLIDVPKPPIILSPGAGDGYQGENSQANNEEPQTQFAPKPVNQDYAALGAESPETTSIQTISTTTSTQPPPRDENHHHMTKEAKYPLNERNCGLTHETRIVGGEEANRDDFLWMAAIIKSRPKDNDVRPFCGGSLITRRHVLTAAHCLENLSPRDVLVRLGSYDFDDSTASSTSSDYAIDQFRVPSHYSKKDHAGDIAIMRLKTPLALTDNYKTVCMPQPRRSYVGALGTVTGYGSQSQTFRRAAPKLRQVTVPIWENRKCSLVYKRQLNDSFLCAGYEEGGKDACQGDSGGPLMTEGPNERMMIVGVVSHGIGCGAPGYPGVYTRVTSYMDWIDTNIRE